MKRRSRCDLLFVRRPVMTAGGVDSCVFFSARKPCIALRQAATGAVASTDGRAPRSAERAQHSTRRHVGAAQPPAAQLSNLHVDEETDGEASLAKLPAEILNVIAEKLHDALRPHHIVRPRAHAA